MSSKIRNPLAGAAAGVVVCILLWRFLFPGSGKTGQDLAIYEITQAGGLVQVDENAPDRPVVRVDFEGLKKTGWTTFAPLGDDGLAHVRPYLEGLPRLRYLRITSMAKISDAGLRQLEGLTQLETIELYGCWLYGNGITQPGLERLRKHLPKVQVSYFDTCGEQPPQLPNQGVLPGP